MWCHGDVAAVSERGGSGLGRYALRHRFEISPLSFRSNAADMRPVPMGAVEPSNSSDRGSRNGYESCRNGQPLVSEDSYTTRLELAAELGRLQCEAEQLNRSIIKMSTNIRAALAARVADRSKWPSMRAEAESKQLPDLMREAARATWLAYRVQQAEKYDEGSLDSVVEVTADRRKSYEKPDDEFSL